MTQVGKNLWYKWQRTKKKIADINDFLVPKLETSSNFEFFILITLKPSLFLLIFNFTSIVKISCFISYHEMFCGHCVKSVQMQSFFLVRFFLYSDWIQENTNQKKLRIWALFRQWESLHEVWFYASYPKPVIMRLLCSFVLVTPYQQKSK